MTWNLCEDVAASWVPTVAAAASSGTSVRFSGPNFDTCIITVVLPFTSRLFPGYMVMNLQKCQVLHIVMIVDDLCIVTGINVLGLRGS